MTPEAVRLGADSKQECLTESKRNWSAISSPPAPRVQQDLFFFSPENIYDISPLLHAHVIKCCLVLLLLTRRPNGIAGKAQGSEDTTSYVLWWALTFSALLFSVIWFANSPEKSCMRDLDVVEASPPPRQKKKKVVIFLEFYWIYPALTWVEIPENGRRKAPFYCPF